jgi:hypothetical protein
MMPVMDGAIFLEHKPRDDHAATPVVTAVFKEPIT